MNTSNILINKYYKNYNELCEALEIEPCQGGKQRKLQQQEIGRYLNLEKEKGSHRYKVLEKYDLPKEKTDKRSDKKMELEEEFITICNYVVKKIESCAKSVLYREFFCYNLQTFDYIVQYNNYKRSSDNTEIRAFPK